MCPKEYTFHNVTITLEADTGKEAYERLCELLSRDETLEYGTTTYSVEGSEPRLTNELWPK